MHKTKQPLHVWFWAAYLVLTQTPGMSALQFQRQLGLSRYETAFQLFQKLRAGMVRPDKDRIGGEWTVKFDESFVGGRTKGKGRGNTDAPLAIAAVEVRERIHPKSGRRNVYAGRLRLRQIVSRERAELEDFIKDSIEPGSDVRTDGWVGTSFGNSVELSFGTSDFRLRITPPCGHTAPIARSPRLTPSTCPAGAPDAMSPADSPLCETPCLNSAAGGTTHPLGYNRGGPTSTIWSASSRRPWLRR